MTQESIDLIKSKCEDQGYKKLEELGHSKLFDFIAKFTRLCDPDSIYVCSDSEVDIEYIKFRALEDKAELELKIKGHRIHFDGYNDQARDKENTKYLLPKDVDLGPYRNTIDKEKGLKEMNSLLEGIMKGRTLFVQFFCLGPRNSEFSIPAVQLTDSSYVAHSQNILYRQGYNEFKKIDELKDFFKFIHSQGELKENNTSKNIDKRRIYIDIEEDIIYSVNTQYGGNTIGHKKLAMRLAINKASEQDWLTEHMFLMGVNGPESRITYFTGAFPSLCGKTSTSMIKGERIVGDDIVYLRVKDDNVYAVNVEKGIFGIIQGINSKDDPLLWKALNSPSDIIFSNILLKEDKSVYWNGKDEDTPDKGFNYSGDWFLGKKDENSKEMLPSHPNARFTIDMKLLENIDPKLEDPKGVAISGMIYGGRDSDTWVPVEESFNWVHGIITKGASLESETTAAALGKTGVRQFNPMANLAFLSIPLSKYIENNIRFGSKLQKPPYIFSVNYFLKNQDGKFLNSIEDKAIWLKWMELRVHRDVDAIKIPTGYIPKYENLQKLFKQVLNKNYTQEDYNEQFVLRIPENFDKIERILAIYKELPDTPPILFKILEQHRQDLEDTRSQYGDYILPDKFIK